MERRNLSFDIELTDAQWGELERTLYGERGHLPTSGSEEEEWYR